jgi:hypothetical protein
MPSDRKKKVMKKPTAGRVKRVGAPRNAVAVPPSAGPANATLSFIARTLAPSIHATIRAYNATYGDHSLPAWEHLDPALADSTALGILAVLLNPNTTPEAQHDAWLGMRREAGWKYGPEKDMNAKTNPAMVPYTQLPPHQRLKDTIFLQATKNAVYRHRVGIFQLVPHLADAWRETLTSFEPPPRQAKIEVRR